MVIRTFKLMGISVVLSLYATMNLAVAASPSHDLRLILQNIKTLKANFKQQLYSSNGKLLQQSAGKIAVIRPGQFRWQVDSPNQQLIVADGRRMWVYDPDLKQATYSNEKAALGQTPAAILSDASPNVVNNFYTRKYKGRYVLTPKISNEFKQIQLTFNGIKITKIQVWDKLGQRSVILFSNVAVNNRLPASMFRFKPPRGVDVIGQ